METKSWMVIKTVYLAPAKPQGLIEKYLYRADTKFFAGDEVISKGLTEEEAVSLAKLMQ